MSMSNQDRETLDTLFGRLAEVERRAAPRDAEADALIRDHIARQPGAPYFMAQTIVMQDYALKEAQRRIADLESRAAGRDQPGSLFPSGFAGQPAAAPAAAPEAGPWSQAPAAAPDGPWSQAAAPSRAGGFLAGAAQTAMGVAGGVLLGNAISGLFGHGGGLGGLGGLGSLGGGERIVEEPTVINEDVFVNDDRQATADQPQDDDTSGGGIFDSFFGGDDQSA